MLSIAATIIEYTMMPEGGGKAINAEEERKNDDNTSTKSIAMNFFPLFLLRLLLLFPSSGLHPTLSSSSSQPEEGNQPQGGLPRAVEEDHINH